VVGHQAVVVEPHGEALPVSALPGGGSRRYPPRYGTHLAIVPAIHHAVVEAHRLLLPARYAGRGMIHLQLSSTVPSGVAAPVGRPAASAA
jgi:hypothetical protein